MEVQRARNALEATALADALRQSGKYDWFRGQKNNWPLRSSYARLDKGKQTGANPENETNEKLKRFHSWICSTPGLEDIRSHRDAIWAVAQHYGLPTNYIDFTIEPRIATFFATDAKTDTEDACILCLSRADLKDFWSRMPSKYPPPEFIDLDVSNLWRLQAQKGRFLFCPYSDFENIYDLDRILFRHDGSFPLVTRGEMYPSRKSQLEILLDQYFDNERRIVTNKAFASMPFNWVNVGGGEAKCSPEMLRKGRLPPVHPTWSEKNLRDWRRLKNEPLARALSETRFTCSLHASEDVQSVVNRVSGFVLKQITATKGCRDRLVRWSFPVDELSSKVDNGESLDVGWLVQLLWDGLRNLPYSDADIADGIGVLAALITCVLRGKTAHSAICSECLGDAIEVDIGAQDGSGARAYVSKKELRRAVRHDIRNCLADPDDSASLSLLLQAMWTPSHLFDFNALAKIWARQIAPTQVLIYKNDNVVFYSPARIDAFGLP